MSISLILHTPDSVNIRIVSRDEETLRLFSNELVDIEGLSQLRQLVLLNLDQNCLARIPPSVFAVTTLVRLDVCSNLIAAIPPEIGELRHLRLLYASQCRIRSVARELGRLVDLVDCDLDDNELTELPRELRGLRALGRLSLRNNRLAWLPLELDALSPGLAIMAAGNPLPVDVGDAWANSRDLLPEIFAATTALSMIREPSTTLCIGLQDLFLPALVTLEIIDAAFPNSIPMHKKWDLVVAVKHFHQRRAQ